MVNSFIFTGLILLAGLAGGLIGSACGKRRNAPDVEARIAELEDRLDALATHCMDEAKKHKARLMSLEDSMDAFQSHCLEQEQAIHAQLDEHEFLIGDTPTGGLLGRVGALEDARSREDLLGRANMLTDNVNVLIDEVQELKKGLKGLQKEAQGE